MQWLKINIDAICKICNGSNQSGKLATKSKTKHGRSQMQLPKYHKRKEFSLLHNCILSYGGKAAHVIVPNSKSAGGLRDFMLRKANIKTPY